MNHSHIRQILGLIILISSGYNISQQYTQNNQILSQLDTQERHHQNQFKLILDSSNKTHQNIDNYSDKKQISISYLEKKIFNKVNKYRLNNGLEPLKIDMIIRKIARSYSIKMANNGEHPIFAC